MLFQSDTELGHPSRLLAIAVFLGLVVAALSAVVRDRPRGGRQRAQALELATTDEAPASVEMALVWVDAIPWGRIERIVSSTGETHFVPSPAETPVMLEIPAGDWVVTLSNPDAEEDRQCELSVSLNAPANCLIEFDALSVDDYFREAGWWR